ncbi:MAG: HD domain-containing protein [Candidatus Moranbacteria bacterium]|nr:HD domain-containing protein [Candidatus Moranbacteria bacterium]
MTKKQLLEAIETEAKKYFVDVSGCHDWTHVERVRALAKRIAKAEGADLFVVEAAALLHDIAKTEEMRAKGGFCHAKEGAKRATEILTRLGVGAEDIGHIAHCIHGHRNRSSAKPESLEAKILFDADKIDSLGAVGVARDFLFAGMIGVTKLYSGNEAEHAKNPKKFEYTEDDTAILEYETHLKGIKDRMLTKTGKAIARERSDFMEDFFSQFWDEVKGRE